MLKMSIKFDDKKMYDFVKKQKATLRVGFWGDVYEENERGYYALKPNGKMRRFSPRKAVSVADVAISNEYGVPEKNVPPRPFMRRTKDRNFRKWHRLVQDRLPVTLDAKKTLLELGEVMADDIRQSIIDYDYPPNAPSTVAIKGFNDPLVDSGQMAESVRMEVK